MKKSMEEIRLIYHTTPHRGLELLVPVFEFLCNIFPELPIHLDVYSSFRAYSNPERDRVYEHVFEKCRNHPKITYHGYQPNEVIRKALGKAHIFAYPNIWQETSCLAVIEAMSAKCKVLCSDLGALPETCAGFATLYPYDEDPDNHANTFLKCLVHEINMYWTAGHQKQLDMQKQYFDTFYSWDNRMTEWKDLLTS